MGGSEEEKKVSQATACPSPSRVLHQVFICRASQFYVMEPGAVFATFEARSENSVCGSFGEYGGNISRSSFIVASPTAFLEVEWLNPVRVRHRGSSPISLSAWHFSWMGSTGGRGRDPPEGKLPPWEYQLYSLPAGDDTCPLGASGISGRGNPRIKKANTCVSFWSNVSFPLAPWLDGPF